MSMIRSIYHVSVEYAVPHYSPAALVVSYSLNDAVSASDTVEIYAPLLSAPIGSFSFSTSCLRTAKFTGSWESGSAVLNVQSLVSGNIQMYETLYGNGIPPNTIVSSFDASVQFKASVEYGSTTISVTEIVWGEVGIGQIISGNGVDSSSTIVKFISGNGGVGTYEMSVAGNDPNYEWQDELYTLTSNGGVGKYTLSNVFSTSSSALIYQTNSSNLCPIEWDDSNNLLKIYHGLK